MGRFLKRPRFWLAVCMLTGIAVALPLIIRTRESVSEARLRKVRVGMTQDEVIALLGQPEDGARALLWRDERFWRRRQNRPWVHFERIRDWWQGSQGGYESFV